MIHAASGPTDNQLPVGHDHGAGAGTGDDDDDDDANRFPGHVPFPPRMPIACVKNPSSDPQALFRVIALLLWRSVMRVMASS
jgi:hypothetical protein